MEVGTCSLLLFGFVAEGWADIVCETNLQESKRILIIVQLSTHTLNFKTLNPTKNTHDCSRVDDPRVGCPGLRIEKRRHAERCDIASLQLNNLESRSNTGLH